MNFGSVEGVAKALLYEGYLLYPYRKTSVKNAKRWTFGTLYQKRQAERTMERSYARAEVLARGDSMVVGVRAVFLASCERVTSDGDRRVEAIERRIEFGPTPVEELLVAQSVPFACSARTWVDGDARYATRALEGVLEVGAAHLAPGVVKLSARLENTTPAAGEPDDDAELVSFGSAHLLFASEGGAFVSLLEPPADLAALTKACRNEGLWPVLVGEAGRGDGMLASPVIVYDYPAVARESHGDYFDATEMDEMLALRLRTLTDAEKREVYAGDPRAAAVLARSEALGDMEILSLHGARRDDEPKPGDRVRLRPHSGRDAFDVLLRGEVATVVSVEEDFEGKRYCAVAIDADPGRDLGYTGQPGHRFFFEPDELERLP